MKKDIITNLKKTARVLGKKIEKRSPEILLGCGIVGFVSTCVLVAKEAPVAKEKLEELHEELAEMDEDLTKPQIIFEEFKVVAPVYAPSFGLALLSSGCLIWSFKGESKKAVAAATGYEFYRTKYFDLRDKVKEELGERKANKIETDLAQDDIKNSTIPDDYISNDVVMSDGMSLFYDGFSGRYFRSTVDIVRRAELEISKRIMIEDYVALNEFYYELGIANTGMGDLLGFSQRTGIEVDLRPVMAPNSEPATSINYCIESKYLY